MKDGGVKSKIIKKYLPVMNQQINKYLQMMDFYINFTLDEEFKEVIKSPVHEDFSYESFSEGEKMRIDLAATIHLAKLILPRCEIPVQIFSSWTRSSIVH